MLFFDLHNLEEQFFFFFPLREPTYGFANHERLLICVVSTIGIEGKCHLYLELQLENHWKNFD